MAARPLALVLAIVLTACGATAPTGQQALSQATAASTPAPLLPGTAAASTTAASRLPVGDAPVTEVMAGLDLSGEPFAAIGDPDAPLTVVEFSDFG